MIFLIISQIQKPGFFVQSRLCCNSNGEPGFLVAWLPGDSETGFFN